MTEAAAQAGQTRAEWVRGAVAAALEPAPPTDDTPGEPAPARDVSADYVGDLLTAARAHLTDETEGAGL